MPLLTAVCARGPKLSVQFSETFNAHCARIGYELGADFVRVQYTGSRESFARVVKAVPIPVVIAGGPHVAGDREVRQMVWESLDAGGAGQSVGRNVFGADNVSALCRARAGIIHEGLGVSDALDLLNAGGGK